MSRMKSEENSNGESMRGQSATGGAEADNGRLVMNAGNKKKAKEEEEKKKHRGWGWHKGSSPPADAAKPSEPAVAGEKAV
jgi:hypothetical protein